MNVLFFGTYDEARHPRVRALREGFVAAGWDVDELNEPLADSTATRVAATKGVSRAALWFLQLMKRWRLLRKRAKTLDRAPDVVVVGYLGVFDAVLARRLFTRSVVVLDHLAPLAETVIDRGGGPITRGIAVMLDALAELRADIVVVDTEEHARSLGRAARSVVVVRVGAPNEWFCLPRSGTDGLLRVVFFGLYTPLQGTTIIGEAIALLGDVQVEFTMVGTGQEYEECRRAAGENGSVEWIDWVDAESLPDLVAAHDVCLGVFGAQAKTQLVVPNKVVQGAAAGCAIITGDSPPVRRLFGDAAVLVPVNDAGALAGSIRLLAQDRELLAGLRASASAVADSLLRPSNVIKPLLGRLEPDSEATS
jgi:glycosyltransferase involved in cell wall biosynthesis